MQSAIPLPLKTDESASEGLEIIEKAETVTTQKIWIRRAKSFAEARDQDLDYYLKMGAQERLEIVQYLREQYAKFLGKNANESGKGLRRTVRVVQQA